MHMPKLAFLLAIGCGSILQAARPAEQTEAERRAQVVAVRILDRLDLARLPVLRQAANEASFDQELRDKLDHLLAQTQAKLQPLLVEGQKDPRSADVLIEQGRFILSTLNDDAHQLLTAEQYEE